MSEQPPKMQSCCAKKILVAEDNDESRKMLRFFIETLGHQVIEAGSAGDAIELAASTRPDLILMDLNMPGIDGLAAIAGIRARPDLSAIPIVASSSDGSRGIELFSNIDNFGPGRIEYIPKPFSFAGLGHRIDLIFAAEPNEEVSCKSAAS